MAGPERSPEAVAALYDAVAADYDHLLREDLWMRHTLWRRYRVHLPAGSRVLDVACGTGLDALHLARRGVRVSAFDVSAGMLEKLRQKAESEGLADRLEVKLADAGDLGGPDASFDGSSFDGIVSAFAGLNTVPDLGRFAEQAHRLLKPGGRVIAHLLAPRGHQQERVLEAPDGEKVRHRVLPAAETYRRFFAEHFHLERAYALGFLWPRRLGRVLPLSLARLGGLAELALGRVAPFRGRGRFVVLELLRKERA